MKYNLELSVLKAAQMNRMTRGDEAHRRLNPIEESEGEQQGKEIGGEYKTE